MIFFDVLMVQVSNYLKTQRYSLLRMLQVQIDINIMKRLGAFAGIQRRIYRFEGEPIASA